jgi:hypothetical protein
LRKFLLAQRLVFAVAFDYETGKIKREAFYALNIPGGELPTTANGRLRKFFAEAFSYDQQQTRSVAWSYGNGDSKYMKGKASYTRDLQDWVKCEKSRAGKTGPVVGGCKIFYVLLRL